jgi:hypothetical protein
MGCHLFDLKTTGMIFSGLASKTVAMIFFSLASKPVLTIFSGLASKLVATVFSGLALKPVAMVYPVLASKLVVGFLDEPQNQGGGGFHGLSVKTGSYNLVIWASKSPVTVSWFGP